MAEGERPEQLTREVKNQLNNMVIGIELTLISIIQGLALGVLAASAVQPLIHGQVEYWPYIATGLLVILIFWSRSLIHTLSFIGWPLEFGHTFIYFAATLIEAVALTQVTAPENWFALNTLYSAFNWFLYGYDLRVIRRHAPDFQTADEQKLYADIVADQLLNLRFTMPSATLFHLFGWWLIRSQPGLMLAGGWHTALGIASALVGVVYLSDGVRILHRRREWIVSRYVQERSER
jgi:hypothetical protein